MMPRGEKILGKPCPNGHPGVRYARTKGCVVCAVEHSTRSRDRKRAASQQSTQGAR